VKRETLIVTPLDTHPTTSYIASMLPPLPAPKAQPTVPDNADTKTLAKAYAPQAIKELFTIGTNLEAKDAARVSALKTILEEAQDKTEGSGNYTIIINQINAALAGKPPVDVTPRDN
jgi:hypothetical protein